MSVTPRRRWANSQVHQGYPDSWGIANQNPESSRRRQKRTRKNDIKGAIKTKQALYCRFSVSSVSSVVYLLLQLLDRDVTELHEAGRPRPLSGLGIDTAVVLQCE